MQIIPFFLFSVSVLYCRNDTRSSFLFYFLIWNANFEFVLIDAQPNNARLSIDTQAKSHSTHGTQLFYERAQKITNHSQSNKSKRKWWTAMFYTINLNFKQFQSTKNNLSSDPHSYSSTLHNHCAGRFDFSFILDILTQTHTFIW